MIYRLEPTCDNLQGKISSEKQPILTIDPGDTIVAGTRNCDWCWEAPPSPDLYPERPKIEDRKDPANDVGNCLMGPVAVRGAEPGMTMEISIDDMKVASYGIAMRGGTHRERYEKLDLPDDFAWLYWTLDAEKGTATNNLGHTVKMRPFLGSIGLAPGEPGYHNNMAPYSCGGNMDCKDLIKGSKLYLPIQAPGGLLSFGDGHAAQGDGEIGGSAIECPMTDVTLTVSLLDDMPIKWPVAKTPEGWIAFGFSEKVDDAMFIAISGMLDLMTKKLGVSRVEASMLASMLVDLRITQMVNPILGVHAFWPHDALL
jgi:acetamidase/formamidase